MNQEKSSANIDVAINVFAKPWQLSLSVLSLLQQSGQHIHKLWLQYEPLGSKFDKLPPYCIYEYIKEQGLVACEAFQPEIWIAREATDRARLNDSTYRLALRYQYAWENSSAPYLFIMHNDVYILRDILGPMYKEIGDAFAIGQIGQCWNCPASKKELTGKCLGRAACTPETYQDFAISHGQLCDLYAAAAEAKVFTRPYGTEDFKGDFESQPWPLPECRVNEWACLVNLAKTRPLCVPYGPVFPFGGFGQCGGHNLDIGTVWFRELHARGLKARHFNLRPYMKHWVGTGSKSAARYNAKEENALKILCKHFPQYIEWIKRRYQIRLPDFGF